MQLRVSSGVDFCGMLSPLKSVSTDVPALTRAPYKLIQNWFTADSEGKKGTCKFKDKS